MIATRRSSSAASAICLSLSASVWLNSFMRSASLTTRWLARYRWATSTMFDT